MNWKRGLIRLWVVASVAWVGIIGFAHCRDIGCTNLTGGFIYVGDHDGSIFRFSEAASDREILETLSKHSAGQIKLTEERLPLDHPRVGTGAEPSGSPSDYERGPTDRENPEKRSLCRGEPLEACNRRLIEQERVRAIANARAKADKVTQEHWEAVTTAFIPPIVPPILWLIVAWVARGFRARKHS